MTYPPVPQRTPPRSPWGAPIVIAALIAGVLTLGAGSFAAWKVFHGDSDSSSAGPGTSTTQPTTTTASTSGSSTTSSETTTNTTTETSTTTTETTTTTHADVNIPGADWQGFTAGPSCNVNDPAVAIGRTERSRVVICQVGSDSSRLYYKGVADGNSIELDFPVRSGNTFTATNDNYRYQVGPSALVITRGSEVVTSELMQDYWVD